MVTPEFLDSVWETAVPQSTNAVAVGVDSNPVCVPDGQPRLESNAGESGTHNCGEAAMRNCAEMLTLGSAAAKSGSAFFDPAMLAQLDAALAHELAGPLIAFGRADFSRLPLGDRAMLQAD